MSRMRIALKQAIAKFLADYHLNFTHSNEENLKNAEEKMQAFYHRINTVTYYSFMLK